MKSHIQNSTNHFFWDDVIARSHIALTIHLTWPNLTFAPPHYHAARSWQTYYYYYYYYLLITPKQLTCRNIEICKIFPKGLDHVTPEIFGIRSNISSKRLELETSNLVHSFIWGKPSGRSNNFPQKGRGLGHVTPKMFGIQSNISSELLELQTSNLVHCFLLEKPSGACIIFPKMGVA